MLHGFPSGAIGIPARSIGVRPIQHAAHVCLPSLDTIDATYVVEPQSAQGSGFM